MEMAEFRRVANILIFFLKSLFFLNNLKKISNKILMMIVIKLQSSLVFCSKFCYNNINDEFKGTFMNKKGSLIKIIENEPS
jgi:hypothetical protein